MKLILTLSITTSCKSMKLYEIKKVPSSEQVYDALQDWFDWRTNPTKKIPIILASTDARNFRTDPGVSTIYRALTIRNGAIHDQIAPQNQIIAYTSKIRAAHEFIKTFAHGGDYVIFKKKFNPSYLILNVSDFGKHIDLQFDDGVGPGENELWMKRTEYYTTFDKSEMVFDTRSNTKFEDKKKKELIKRFKSFPERGDPETGRGKPWKEIHDGKQLVGFAFFGVTTSSDEEADFLYDNLVKIYNTGQDPTEQELKDLQIRYLASHK